MTTENPATTADVTNLETAATKQRKLRLPRKAATVTTDAAETAAPTGRKINRVYVAGAAAAVLGAAVLVASKLRTGSDASESPEASSDNTDAA